MSESSNQIEIIRVLKAPPERVFKALSDPNAVIRWQPPFGFIGTVEQWDFEVGGRFRMAFTKFSNDQSHSFGGSFLEIVENKKIVVDDSFDSPELVGQIVNTSTLKPVINGTLLTVHQQSIPDQIPLEFCYAGWQESMIQLAQLVEACVPETPTEC